MTSNYIRELSISLLVVFDIYVLLMSLVQDKSHLWTDTKGSNLKPVTS